MKKVDFIGKKFYLSEGEINDDHYPEKVIVVDFDDDSSTVVCTMINNRDFITMSENSGYSVDYFETSEFLKKYVAVSPTHVITYYKGASERYIEGTGLIKRIPNILCVVSEYKTDDKSPREILVFDFLKFAESYARHGITKDLRRKYCYITNYNYFNNNMPCFINLGKYEVLDVVNCYLDNPLGISSNISYMIDNLIGNKDEYKDEFNSAIGLTVEDLKILSKINILKEIGFDEEVFQFLHLDPVYDITINDMKSIIDVGKSTNVNHIVDRFIKDLCTSISGHNYPYFINTRSLELHLDQDSAMEHLKKHPYLNIKRLYFVLDDKVCYLTFDNNNMIEHVFSENELQKFLSIKK